MNFCQKTIKIAQRLFGTEEYVFFYNYPFSFHRQDSPLLETFVNFLRAGLLCLLDSANPHRRRFPEQYIFGRYLPYTTLQSIVNILIGITS